MNIAWSGNGVLCDTVGMDASRFKPSEKPVFQKQDFSREIPSLPLARPCQALGHEKYDPTARRVEIFLDATRWPRTGRCGVSPLEWGVPETFEAPARGKAFPLMNEQVT